jgi:hypothetical protein
MAAEEGLVKWEGGNTSTVLRKQLWLRHDGWGISADAAALSSSFFFVDA